MNIPNNEILFRYAKPEAFPEGQTEIPLGIFIDQELSCDWKKYRTDPHSSYHIEEGKSVIIQITICDDIRNPKNPKRIGQVIPEWKQEIIHDPILNNQDTIHGENLAHSLIKGKKKAAVVDAIRNNSKRI